MISNDLTVRFAEAIMSIRAADTALHEELVTCISLIAAEAAVMAVSSAADNTAFVNMGRAKGFAQLEKIAHEAAATLDEIKAARKN